MASDPFCYRDQFGTSYTHNLSSKNGGPYICQRCGKEIPTVVEVVAPEVAALRSRLAEAERLLRESFAPGTNGGPLCPRCGYEGYDGAKKGHYPDCALVRWLEGR